MVKNKKLLQGPSKYNDLETWQFFLFLFSRIYCFQEEILLAFVNRFLFLISTLDISLNLSSHNSRSCVASFCFLVGHWGILGFKQSISTKVLFYVHFLN